MRPSPVSCAASPRLGLLLPLMVASSGARAGEDRDDPLFPDDEPAIGSVRRAHAFGLGLGVGTSTAGVSMKYWMRETLAVQGVVGAGFRRDDPEPSGLVESDRGPWQAGLGLSGDLLFERSSFAAAPDFELGWSFGPGVGLWLGDELAVAVAGVLGLEVGMLPVPIDLVVEYRPRVVVFPDPAFDWINASAHLRWYF